MPSITVFSSPPLKEGMCDHCNKELTKRADDNKETIVNRLKVFNKETYPLVQYYENKGLLKKIDANQNPDNITKDMINAYNDTFPSISRDQTK
ncbi:hypothetical protein N9Y92_04405 [Chlamydiales bacterium]|nr:hypothetical protein [Chlamydiales bacterium]